MASNFLGPVNCLAALQTQLEAGDRVVLVSSMAHWLPFPRAEAYGASKAALSWFANSLRLDWEPKGWPSRWSLRASSTPADAQKRLRHARPGERGSGGGGDPPWPGEGQKPHRLPHRFQPGPASAGQSAIGIQRLLLRRMVRSCLSPSSAAASPG